MLMKDLETIFENKNKDMVFNDETKSWEYQKM